MGALRAPFVPHTLPGDARSTRHMPAGRRSHSRGFPLARTAPLREKLERAGLVTDHIEGFPEDYAETLRRWARRLDERLEEARRLAGPERCRVWRLYLRGARNGFETGFTSVYQVSCRLPGGQPVTASQRE